MATPESLVKEKVKAVLKKLGVQYFMPSAGVYGRSGASDFICCMGGRYVAIETKATAGDKPTKLQQLFLDQVRRCGGMALVVSADNVGTLETLLRNGLLEEELVHAH